MSKKQNQKGDIRITVKGNVGGQIAVGNNNTQFKSETHYSITTEDMEKLHQMLSELRIKVGTTAQPEKKTSALEQVKNLDQAIMGKKPDVSKMEKVKNWFGKNMPALAGAVTSVIVHPIVGKLVEAGGDLLVKDFQQRFGGDS